MTEPIKAAKQGVGMAVAIKAANHAKTALDQLLLEVRYIRQYVTGRKHFELPGHYVLAEGEKEASFKMMHGVPAGYTFIIRRLTAQAPKGCLLELYRHTIASGNFIEVVTNIQVYANDVPGTQVVEGPAIIWAVVSGAEAAGNIAITLGGDLVPTSFVKFKEIAA